MLTIRKAEVEDIIEMQQCNLLCLPENYNMRYYYYHYLSWPHLLMVAEDDGKIVGYAMGKMNDEEKQEEAHGHITSLAVLRTHRKLGIATQLMQAAQAQMESVFGAYYVSLHVRKGNVAAFHLYSKTLAYEISDLEVGYYADGEDAYEMKKPFKLLIEKRQREAESAKAAEAAKVKA